jgi:hypothetical protein
MNVGLGPMNLIGYHVSDLLSYQHTQCLEKHPALAKAKTSNSVIQSTFPCGIVEPQQIVKTGVVGWLRGCWLTEPYKNNLPGSCEIS